MKRLIYAFVLLAGLILLQPAGQVQADEEAPWVVKVTRPVSAEVRSAVEAWMGSEAAPVQTTYWAITYTKPLGFDTIVSLVALELETPDETWSITDDDKVLWMGTVIVRGLDDSVEMYSTDPYDEAQGSAAPKIAAPVPAAGGGAHVRFPWQAGGTMMYGPRGVHPAGGGGEYATGFLAVDLVGGDDMGSGVAPPRVYAATAGVVDYVCSDSNTTLVRTYNSTTNDYFIYAHMVDNANLEMDHPFAQGELIGTLKYGSFNDTCGWAEQKDNHYHLHFGFQAASGAMRIEGCILSISSQEWSCGTQTVRTGQFLLGGGGGGGDPGDSVSQVGFWDYAMGGVVSIFTRTILDNMPNHSALLFTDVLYTSVKMALRVAYVMVRSNINLLPLATVFLFGFFIKVFFSIAEFIVFLAKAWKSLVPIWGA